jgi:hypothetical protein
MCGYGAWAKLMPGTVQRLLRSVPRLWQGAWTLLFRVRPLQAPHTLIMIELSMPQLQNCDNILPSTRWGTTPLSLLCDRSVNCQGDAVAEVGQQCGSLDLTPLDPFMGFTLRRLSTQVPQNLSDSKPAFEMLKNQLTCGWPKFTMRMTAVCSSHLNQTNDRPKFTMRMTAVCSSHLNQTNDNQIFDRSWLLMFTSLSEILRFLLRNKNTMF